jgi:nucleoside-diphosphate-sugar epimerase
MNAKQGPKSVAVIGAAGYIGSRVVAALSQRQIRTIAIVHPSEHAERVERISKLTHVEVIQFDITSGAPDPLKKIGSPDACIHLAWKNGFNHQDPQHLQAGLQHLAFLNALMDAGLTSLAVAGTAHEVGFFEGRVTETTPCNPANNYGIAKNFLRQALMLSAKQKQARLMWLRFFYIFGHDEENNSVLTKLLAAARSKTATFAMNDGEILYDFIHVEALAEQIVACLFQRHYEGIIHCCTGSPVTLKTMVQRFVTEQHLDIQLEFGKFPFRSYDSRALWGDATVINHIMKENTPKS